LDPGCGVIRVGGFLSNKTAQDAAQFLGAFLAQVFYDTLRFGKKCIDFGHRTNANFVVDVFLWFVIDRIALQTQNILILSTRLSPIFVWRLWLFRRPYSV
jgi:hypothetical protein